MVEAEIRLEANRLDEAGAAAEEVLANPEASPGAHDAGRAVLARVFNQAGIRLADGGDPEAALFAFRRAADLDPDWSAPRSNLGAAFEAIGRLDRAEPAYQQAVDSDPDSPAARFNLARLLRLRGDLGGALELVESVVAGDSTELLALHAELCVEAGQTERATEFLDAAVARAPQRPEAWVELAAGWQAAGDSVCGPRIACASPWTSIPSARRPSCGWPICWCATAATWRPGSWPPKPRRPSRPGRSASGGAGPADPGRERLPPVADPGAGAAPRVRALTRSRALLHRAPRAEGAFAEGAAAVAL